MMMMIIIRTTAACCAATAPFGSSGPIRIRSQADPDRSLLSLPELHGAVFAHSTGHLIPHFTLHTKIRIYACTHGCIRICKDMHADIACWCTTRTGLYPSGLYRPWTTLDHPVGVRLQILDEELYSIGSSVYDPPQPPPNAVRGHICTGTRLASAAATPGWGSPLRHLHRDWARADANMTPKLRCVASTREMRAMEYASRAFRPPTACHSLLCRCAALPALQVRAWFGSHCAVPTRLL